MLLIIRILFIINKIVVALHTTVNSPAPAAARRVLPALPVQLVQLVQPAQEARRVLKAYRVIPGRLDPQVRKARWVRLVQPARPVRQEQ